jgi:hypothetical protein
VAGRLALQGHSIEAPTAAQVIHGDRPKVPFGFTESLKKAATEKGEKKQPTLL